LRQVGAELHDSGLDASPIAPRRQRQPGPIEAAAECARIDLSVGTTRARPALDDPTSRSSPRTISGASTCRSRRDSAKISPIQENIFNRRKFVRPRNTISTICVCSDTACCVRCRGEIDCPDSSLYPSPACRPLKCRLHLQRRSVRSTTAAHDARRICGTKDGARRDPRSASRHRRYRHATASSRNVCSCSRH